MISLALTPQQQGWLIDTLASPHATRTLVRLLDLSGNLQNGGDLSARLVDGQVNYDNSGTVTRSASLTLLDPQRTLTFDSDSPANGAMYLDRMIRIQVGTFVPDMNRWVDIPVFTGPIVSLSRDDVEVTIDCLGKESLAQTVIWNPLVVKKGHNTINAIETIMRRAGETAFDFPSTSTIKNKLAADVSLSRESIPWNAAKRLASGLGMQLFYDGRGVCRLRRTPTAASFTFRDGDDGFVVSVPQVSYNTDDVKNLVWVKGGKPKGAKTAVSAVYAAPATEAVNPGRLGRNGVGRYFVEIVEDAHITSKARALAVAKARLQTLMLESVDVSFDVLPFPLLDEGDVIRLATEEFSGSFRFTSASLPLVVGNNMSINYTKRMHAVKNKNKRK